MAVEIKLVLKDGEQQCVDRVLEHLAEKAKDVNGALNCNILENAVKLKRFYYN